MVSVELPRLRRAQRPENAGRVAAEDRTVGHIREAGDRKRSRPHAVREIGAGWRFRGDPGRATMRVDIDGDGVVQHVERRRGGLGGLGCSGRTVRRQSAAEHRADRGQRRVPDPLPARQRVAVAAAIHGVLPSMPRSGSTLH